MALSNVNINQIGGRSGRPLPGFDHYTGMMFYGTAPVVTGKWKQYPGPPAINAQQMFSEVDATNAGIIPYTDNTAPIGSYEITTPGVAGDTLQLKVTIPAPKGLTTVIDLGVYTVPTSGAATAALQATAYVALINAGTVTHGYTATVLTSTTVQITAPKTVGKSINTGTPLSAVIVGAFVGSITQFTGGTASNYAAWYYQISEYFAGHPQGVLWVGIIAASSSFNEIKTLQTGAAEGKLMQAGVYDIHATRGLPANITSTIASVQTAVATLQAITPINIVYSPNMQGAILSDYPDQNINTANKVQCVISEDGGAEGAQLHLNSGFTVGNLGRKLATISKSRVSASDAQPIALFNNSDGVENNDTAFGNGDLSSNVTEGLQAQLDSYNYTFFRKFGSTVVGSYWNDNKCCITRSSDYSNVNDNRTFDKISRICYDTLVPQLHSELLFNEDGTLQDYTIEYFKDIVTDAVTNNMITGYGALPLIGGVTVDIDPTQDVKQTSNLIIDITIVQNGIARNITVNIAYA